MNGKKIVVVTPTTDQVDRLRPHVRTVLTAIGIGPAYVTDRSTVGHFVAEKELRARRDGKTEDEISQLIALEESMISQRLGFEVTCSTYIWHAAEAVADREVRDAERL
jgi:hypothetical protein